MKVVSTKTCFFGGRRYRPGVEFDLPKGVKPSGDMTPVSEGSVSGKRASAKEPGTFSEKAKIDGDAQKAKGTDDLV